MYINCSSLNQMIKNHKKVLIFAPGRRSGKTEFIVRQEFKENHFYFTLSKGIGNVLEKRMLNRNHISQHQYIKDNINIDYRYYRKTDTVFLDDVLFMKESFIESILAYDMNIIGICDYIPNYDYNLFVKNGFTILLAPCDNISKN